MSRRRQESAMSVEGPVRMSTARGGTMGGLLKRV